MSLQQLARLNNRAKPGELGVGNIQGKELGDMKLGNGGSGIRSTPLNANAWEWKHNAQAEMQGYRPFASKGW
jgi:hypothetical protein